ncbi:MAG: DUF6198 family protein [Firmicutes bacterium]|nr:DUF6198 family protein [Bacillota bacterium]
MFNKKNILRYLIFLLGLFFAGFGIALSTKMGLGTTPISVIPLVLSIKLPISFGMVANAMALAFVLIEILVQRKGFTKDLLMQIILAPFFGFFIDLGFFLVKNFGTANFIGQITLLIIGCMTMALGVYFQIRANVIVNPIEGLVLAIAERTRKKFSNVKIGVDVSVMLVGVVLSVIAFGEVRGVGITTIVVALGTGYFIKIFKNIFDRLSLVWLYE